ncbi:acyltransferase family protein [Paraglaciecola hydrolytica]|uniref:Acyltransferase 3 domain-containing protein n=1 Tax=Paraglaciecola hydrolytica TaxID=1799789 RepID=A0A148KKN5_9ALTE|nr:acyltransferase [Paraglaciecola hydrolytica]KXI26825.1 hypothetical protein AX660_03395 [Paraglaciecola hydrolytica]
MKKYLADYLSGRNNNFNLVRFIASIMVLVSHSFVIVTGSKYSEPLRVSLNMTWGSIAVDVFFISSGFLIYNSFQRKKSLLSFTWARIVRIYPALFFCVIFTVFAIGIVSSELPPDNYLLSNQVYVYLIKNILLITGIEYQLPGVFLNTPLNNMVNGSLWTLPYELLMYLLLALFLISLKLINSNSNIPLFLLITVIILATVNICIHLTPNLSSSLIKLTFFFFCGATYCAYANKVKLSFRYFILSLVVIIITAFNKDIFVFGYFIFLPYVIFYLAYIPSGFILNFNKLGDYSYGLYLYAFPIQQIIVFQIPNITISQMIVYSFICTLVLAILSWQLIEKRALKMKIK